MQVRVRVNTKRTPNHNFESGSRFATQGKVIGGIFQSLQIDFENATVLAIFLEGQETVDPRLSQASDYPTDSELSD